MKKVLSWVLVLALVLGSFSMAFAGDTDNASNMKDAAQIKNVEAVDVMVATGIIGGYPDGNFYPEKTVTRAEMAKMISVAVNGGEDIGSYYASSCKFADSKDHWAAGYIAYCANEGIIDGRDADTFDPDTTVTGSEAAKMMLVALGYDSKIEKYVGGQWEANVLKAAKANDLFDDLEKFSAGLPLNRDNAAQIIFNGLKAVTVDYAQKDVISIGDVEITQSTKADPVAWKNHDAKADTMNPDDDYVELFEASFEGYLAYAPGAPDSFKRPGHKWFYNEDKVASKADDDKIGTYVDDADYSFVVADNQTLAAELKDYDDDTFGTITTDYTLSAVYENGVKDVNGGNAVVDGTTPVVKGAVVEMYESDTVDNQYTAVIRTYKAVKITDVDTNVSTSDAKNDVTAYVYLDGVKYKDTDVEGYDASTYVEDAIIAVAYGDANAVLDSYVPEKVSGTYTKDYTAKLTVDNTSYDKIGAAFKTISADVKDEVDLYLINGYAAAIVEVDDNSTTAYGVLFAVGKTSFDDQIVKIFTAEGTVVQYDVDKDAGNIFDKNNVGKLIAYSINEDGTVDSVEAGNGNSAVIPDMTKGGLIAGRVVLEDVVVFDYDGVDPDDADSYAVYGYNDLKDADGLKGYYILDEGDIAAVFTTEGVSASDTVIGIFVDKAGAQNNGKNIFDVELLVEGKSVNYDTTSKVVDTDFTSISANDIVAITLNSAGEITSIKEAEAVTGALDPSDDFGDKDYQVFDNSTYKYFVSRDGNKITLANKAIANKLDNDYATYQVNITGNAIYDNYVADDYSLADIAVDDVITLFKFSEDSDSWDVVIF